MSEMIAFCGSSCHECPAFLATRDDDDKKRKETAQLWSKQYDADIKPEGINCNGCRSVGAIHFDYCNVCGIRKCGTEKDIENCAYCSDYPCEKLEEFFKVAPDNKKRLDALRE